MTREPSKYRTIIYILGFLGIVGAAFLAYEFIYLYPIWTLRAFKVPSSSMCPTICNGERVLVQMRFGPPYVPNRGDVIVMKYGNEKAYFLKRVIGVQGDVVGPGPNGTILVNGNTWMEPSVCSKSLLKHDDNEDMSPYSGFSEVRVSPGHLFVIGDNLANSYDSRIKEFEPVTLDQVIGKPVLIYWSPESSRIGCSVL